MLAARGEEFPITCLTLQFTYKFRPTLLVSWWREEYRRIGEKTSEQDENREQTHALMTPVRESNLRHISGKRAVSPLRHPGL